MSTLLEEEKRPDSPSENQQAPYAAPYEGKRIAFVHTLGALAPVFDQLVAEHLPGAVATHVVDDGFYEAEFAVGALDETEQRRLVEHLNHGEAAEADISVVTCSFLGTYVDELAHEANGSWLRIDLAMAEAALAIGDRIGVLATAESSYRSTVQLLERLASEAGREVQLSAHLVEGAFTALERGDLDTHNSAVADAIASVQGEVDVIVLSQASMAQAIATMTEQPTVPVLTSPVLCFERLRELLA
ncbi:aspartate/glutamate racemase family protein [Ruicaihuangia caeni]|uniref:aspartate/glutamate racemase family protein n=1 Tax=Ruicaihuangia caeni TaxID=3042517 RepID=UPI00338D5FA1